MCALVQACDQQILSHLLNEVDRDCASCVPTGDKSKLLDHIPIDLLREKEAEFVSPCRLLSRDRYHKCDSITMYQEDNF